MSRLARHLNANTTSQREPVIGKAQVQNNAGGYVFQVDDWARLDRFLILGSEGGTYYVGERKLTRDNAAVIERLLKVDGVRLVNRVVEISDSGRAPKNDPAILALAMAAKLGTPETKQAANATLAKVCRIGTHLFSYAESVEAVGGWGSGTRRAVGRWFNDKDPRHLAEQLAKYKSRNGWSQRDLLRLTHPIAKSPEHNALFHWAVKGELPENYAEIGGEGVAFLHACDTIKTCTKPKAAAALIREYKLPREVVPTELLNSVEVWDALLEHMKPEAMIRNLGKMTQVGLLKPLSKHTNFVVGVLGNAEALKRARLHPIKVLAALLTYKQGHGVKGSLTWDTVNQIVDALDSAFYGCFQAIEPTGKRTLLALDVSGSMGGGECGGVPGLTPRVGSAAMALVTAATEKWHHFVGFSTSLVNLAISPKQRLDTVVKTISGLPFAGTDCALPMIWAAKNKVEVDTFAVYTDNETWAGNVHPFQALKQYRQAMGIPAKLIVVGMTATDFSIADPSDAGMLDVVGFDTAAPAIMADFARQ